MAIWGVAESKGEAGAMLDKVETDGPQGGPEKEDGFYLLTKEQLAERCKTLGEEKPLSAAGSLRPLLGDDDVGFHDSKASCET